MPTTDTYIDKEALINDEIDKLRHAATTALLTRRDVIVVASVSCIYGLGAPEVYAQNIFKLKIGDEINRQIFARRLIELQYSRTNSDLKRGTFRLRGEQWEIMPPDRELIYTFEIKGGIIKEIYEVDPVKGFQPGSTLKLDKVILAPAKHFITPPEDRERAIKAIKDELRERLKYFEKNGKLLEAERLERRTKFDLAMMKEVGYCHGIENYSRHLSGRSAGEAPDTLLNYFPKTESGKADFLTIIDESHVTVPQIRGMYFGDASRKKTLVEYGFRLPSASDNRPLKFNEFESRIAQVIYTSATPAEFEREKSKRACEDLSRAKSRGYNPGIVEQIIRPTGLVDPKITVRPVRGQIDDLIPRIEDRVAKKERVLVTTLTKKMAEDLSDYLQNYKIRGGEPRRIHGDLSDNFRGGEPRRTTQKSKSKTLVASGYTLNPKFKVAYLHSDVKTLDRIRILTSLRKGEYDVLVGVNLLREGLDLPEVSLVAILDADKEGFLRSETSLIQTIGRAARNAQGEVLMYADNITGSIKRAIDETERRRVIQLAYNKKHGITPKTIIKAIKDILPDAGAALKLELKPVQKSKAGLEKLIKQKEKEMREAASQLDFELAALLRDEIKALTKKVKEKVESS